MVQPALDTINKSDSSNLNLQDRQKRMNKILHLLSSSFLMSCLGQDFHSNYVNMASGLKDTKFASKIILKNGSSASPLGETSGQSTMLGFFFSAANEMENEVLPVSSNSVWKELEGMRHYR